MKTEFFETAYLIRAKHVLPLLLLWPAVLSAQNGVTVSNLAVNAGTVTFNVSWSRQAMQDLNLTLWRDSVWVFVDYNNAGTITRLPLSGATLTATSAVGVGEVVPESGNNQGVWVVGNAKTAGSGSFSATVQLLTATATATGICVYASNYPPVGRYTSASEIAFTGTPPYDLLLDCGGNPSTPSVGSPYTLTAGCTLTSFTDKTGAPGTFLCDLHAGTSGGEEREDVRSMMYDV
jgi:hypothetical protein